MGYQIVALDIDGTVLDGKGQIPSYFRPMSGMLSDMGIHVVFCTGRRWKIALKAIKEVSNTQSVIVCSGGALIKDLKNHYTLHSLPVPLHMVDKVAALYRENGLVPFFLRECELDKQALLISHSDKEKAEKMGYVRKNRSDIEYCKGEIDNFCNSLLEIYTVDKKNKILEVAGQFDDELSEQVRVTALNQPIHGDDHWALEVHGPKTTKWNALELLMEEWNIKDNQVVAIGDDVNDIPMLKKAGISFAMANAVPEAKEAAGHITDSNDNNGVLCALKRIFPELRDLELIY